MEAAATADAAAGGNGDHPDPSITTPLLHQHQQDAAGGDRHCDASASSNEGEWSTCDWPRTALEAKTQLALAAPMIGVNIFQSTLTIVSVMFVGHLDELSLASSSIATSFATVTGYSVMVGLATALETLCGQAQGAHQYRMLGVYLQRGAIVQLLMSLLVTLLWLNTARLLKLLGQDHVISDKAGEYAVWLIPYLYGHAILQPIQRCLQAQAVVLPMLGCSVATMAAHVVLCWLLVYRLDVGFRGAALAASISVWLNVAATALYIQLSSVCRKTWCGFSLGEALQDLRTYFKLAIPSTVMVCQFGVVVLRSPGLTLGLWMGMLCALATQLACLAVITLLLTDWNKQVENAKNRVAASSAATLPMSTTTLSSS